jgi:hypothetical protein
LDANRGDLVAARKACKRVACKIHDASLWDFEAIAGVGLQEADGTERKFVALDASSESGRDINPPDRYPSQR